VFKKLKNIFLFLIGFRTSKKHVYVIRKTLWYQDELTYAEDGRVKEVVKEVVGPGFGLENFGESVDLLYEKGAIPGLFAVVLKPYEPTILHRLWNKAFMPAGGIVPVMKNSEVAQVLSDFFLFNTRWIGDLMSLLPGLGLQTLTTLTPTRGTLQSTKN
jgi:hypothetical protein